MRQQLRSFVSSTDDVVRRPLEAQNDRPVVSFNFVFTLEALLTLVSYLFFLFKRWVLSPGFMLLCLLRI
jgi:hypothetical protein